MSVTRADCVVSEIRYAMAGINEDVAVLGRETMAILRTIGTEKEEADVRLALVVYKTRVVLAELRLAIPERVAELTRLAAPVVLIERVAFGAESR